MTFLMILITAVIFISWPKFTFCNVVLVGVTFGIVSLSGANGGPISFLVIYGLFSTIALYDGLSKRQAEIDAKKEEIEQAAWARAMRDDGNKRSNRRR